MQQELGYRKQLGYPPFARLIRVLFEAREERAAHAAAQGVRAQLPDGDERRTLGPAPAVVTKIKERYRVHLIVKCFSGAAFDDAMRVVRTVEDLTTQAMRVTLDVDPVAML